ncbi:MAG: tetratricopeptide repeat protein [Acidobacteriota bacterium]
MPLLKSLARSRPLVVVLLILTAVIPSIARQSQLGKVEFQITGSQKAREHFLRGLAALHSFWYEEALDAFREATKADPLCLMGYWGEAMAHNHPLWGEQDTAAARKVLENLKDTSRVTEKERAFIEAVRTLYGEGDKRARDKAYSAAMEKIYLAHTDDLEAASFYSLSLLGVVRPEDRGFRNQARAGAIALEVYKKNPNHPGAAHYIIHAFDDPEHAIIALPAAFRYAEIAPAAHHARHMPSHIFLQLGMWPEAAASNESAWQVSDEWVKRKRLPLINRDYHSLHWLLYVYLQQGRYQKAEELLSLMKKVMVESKDDNKMRPNYYANNYANMAATFIVETERWELAAKLFDMTAASSSSASGMDHSAHNSNTARQSNMSQTLPLFVRGMAAAKAGSEESQKSVAEFQSMREKEKDAYRAKPIEIRGLEIAAVAAVMKGRHAEAIEMMKRATTLENEMAPPSGPPSLIKPSHELFGEILLRANRPQEASEAFATAMLRQPNRARSLIGAARAAAAGGDAKRAAEFYSKLVRQWQQADSTLAELREAQDYLKQASQR